MPDTLVQTSKIVELLECNLETKTLLAGTLLKWMDIIACLAAEKHANAPCVTASVDDLQFEKSVSLGQVITLKAWINRAFNTSMEVEVLVNSEDTTNMDKSIICKAFFTFVTQPDKNGKKNFLNPIEPQAVEEKAQFLLANERKKMRLSHNSSLKKMKDDTSNSLELSSPGDSLCETGCISPSSTYCESVEIVLPQHANHHSTTFGGQLMAWMEATSTISARRLCHSQPLLIAVDEVFFRAPSNVGDRVVIRSRVNNTFQRSLEVGVRVEAYAVGGEKRHIQSAYFNYIAPDETGHPKLLPMMKATNKDEQARMIRSEARFRMRRERRAILSSTSPLTAVSPVKEAIEVYNSDEIEGSKFPPQRESILPFHVSTAVSLTKDNEKILCYRNILALMELYDTSSFQLTIQMETFNISQREIDGGLCIRIEMETELPAELVYKVLSDHASRKYWDKATIECTIEQEICKNEDYVLRIVMENPLSENIKGDDFVLLASNRQDSSGTYTIAYRSVVVDSIPPVPEYHRTENRCSGFILEGNKSTDGCKITYINQVTDRVYEYFKNDLRGATDTLKQKEKLMMSHIRERASALAGE